MASSVQSCPAEAHPIDAVGLGRIAAARLEKLLAEATCAVQARVSENGRLSHALLEREQRATHGLAWLATYVFSVRELVHYADRLEGMGRFGTLERLIVQIGLGEYVAQILGGIPMSQGEIVRLADLYLPAESEAALRAEPEIARLAAHGNTAGSRAALAQIIRETHPTGTIGEAGLDETMEAMRTEMHRFVEAEVAPMPMNGT